MTRVWMIGGSGLVGSFVEAKLAAKVGLVSFGRRSPTQPFQRQVDFDRLREIAEVDACDTAISCLGTTIRTAGSQAAMRKVDHDHVIDFAAKARDAGARQFILVSSVGADADSSNFYLRLKGETERDVAKVGFERFDIIRPGLLLGDRREVRPGERFAALLAPALRPLLMGRLEKYRAIRAETVAAAIVELAGKGGRGSAVHENRDIEALARASAGSSH